MNKIIGYKGEQIAKRYLLKQGLTFIDSNFTIWGGEIDLIMKDTAGEIVFVEVKYRRREFLDSMELISSNKVSKLIRTASHWIHRKKAWKKDWRIDLVVIKEDKHNSYGIEWLKNAISER